MIFKKGSFQDSLVNMSLYASPYWMESPVVLDLTGLKV